MTTAASKTPTKKTDAIVLLKADHAAVKKLFKEFEQLHHKGNDAASEKVAAQICQELTIHAAIEEEIFYPAFREASKKEHDSELVDEAEVEHASAKDLIAQIESMCASDDKYAAKVKVLGEYINHHIQEEHDELFPKAQKTKIDLKKLGAQLIARKAVLKAEYVVNHRKQ